MRLWLLPPGALHGPKTEATRLTDRPGQAARRCRLQTA